MNKKSFCCVVKNAFQKVCYKMKKTIALIISLPIRDKEKRHQARKYFVDFHLTYIFGIAQVIAFYFTPIRKNSVLLIEINDGHGEVISGYIAYFQKLGYNVDILINTIIKKENPFCRLNMSKVKLFHNNSYFLGGMIKVKKIKDYKHVFLMTSAYYLKSDGKFYTNVIKTFPKLKTHPSLFIVEHDLADIKRFNEEKLLRQNHLITLGHFDKGVFMSPILFGSIHHKNTPSNETTFITIGAIKTFRRNHQALIHAIEKLKAENLKFKVIVIGSGSLENLPPSIHPYIQIMGRLDFPKMFDCLEKADFFLPLLDANNPEHNRYITTGVTGSAQLIYAFSKIPVLHPKFASLYGFNEQNAILAKNLVQGMRRAIQMSSSEYTQKQSILTKLAHKLEQESLDNLRKILK